jgi:hypothetical protein
MNGIKDKNETVIEITQYDKCANKNAGRTHKLEAADKCAVAVH